MSASSSNVTSPSTSSRPSITPFGTSMVKSGSNRSIFQRETKNKPVTRSRQNTVGGLDFQEDLVRNIGSDYQDIQIRTLTKWVNAHLKPVDDSIKDIKTDLRDGKKLLKLLSVIAKEPAPKPERMNMRIHQLSNVAQALSFLEKQVGSDSMPDIGNEAIVNGDAKKTIALIFFIMLKYQIQLIVTEHGDDFLQSLSELSERENGAKSTSVEDLHIEQPSKPAPLSSLQHRKLGSHQSLADKQHNVSTSAEAKVALLYWVRIQLEDYIAANIIPSIQDFSRSWRNGIAFCLLIHRYNPTYIPDLFSVYLTIDLNEKSSWLQLLKTAFDIGTNQMGVQPYLEPEDLVDVDYPHEPSVMMYISEYYKVMSKYQQEEPLNVKRERAVKRKAEIVMATGGGGDEDTNNFAQEEDEDEAYASSPPQISSPTLSDKPPLIAPTPVPMPSARRKKKMAQRESTLGKEDKERIKADLNSKLLMQLTGHLPRGVHPILDEILTIHETVLSFIKSNSRTIDEIPEEFVSSASVTEYIDALEIIEEQSDNEVSHLVTAKTARDILTAPPETADETVIRLTDLQRTQVSKLYDMLIKEWDQFTELLKTTKEDLLCVETALIDTEEGAEEYQHRANMMEAELDTFIALLTQVAPKVSTENDALLHPFEGSTTDAEEYKTKLSAFSEQFNTFQNASWKDFRKSSRQLSRAVMQVVSVRSNEVMSKYDSLVIKLEQERQSCNNFERGLVFLSKVQAIEEELKEIQSMMEDNNEETTNDDIQQLESKVSAARTTIYSVKEEHGDILDNDDRFAPIFKEIQSKYEIVYNWVDQVRVWFVEAERIRSWIEVRIQQLHTSNEIDIDPYSEDVSQWEKSATERICQEHKQLKKEIERFDQDDMTRLRAHVRALTNATNHNISPADASTIEITLTTLNILNRLMKVLETRSRLIDTLQLRIQWEDFLAKAIEWCTQKDAEINAFMNGKARWSEPEEDEMSTHALKQLTEEVIQSLLSLENSIAQFDKGDFSQVLDRYQEMEALGDSALPTHLEKRQEGLEVQFELIMKRCSFVRKVVEQHLIINDVTAQFRKLRTEGEKLKTSMTHSTDTSSNTSENNTFDAQVQAFKDNSSSWVTTSVKRIPYPETTSANSPEDAKRNATANSMIADRLNDYGNYLAEITEELEALLLSHRENLSLQQRASLAYDDLLRIASWLEERLRALQKFDGSTLLDQEDVIVLEEETFTRLGKEQENISARLEQLEKRDMEKSLDAVRRLEIEIDETNSVSIDRNTLVSGIERLEQGHNNLKKALESRIYELALLKKRITWETQWENADLAINNLAHQLWDFNDKYAQYDTEGLKKKRISISDEQASNDAIIEVDKDTLYADLQNQVVNVSSQYNIITSNAVYEELQQAYAQYNQEEDMPEHIVAKQSNLNERHETLRQLFKYVSLVLTQNNEITNFVSLSNQLQAEGEAAQESIQIVLRESSSTPTTSNNSTAEEKRSMPEVSQKMLDRMLSVQDQINQLCQTANSVEYLQGGNWFESYQPQALVQSDDYNKQLKIFISKRVDTLVKLKESLQRLLSNYQYNDAIKSKLEEYQKEAVVIQDWMDKSSETLNQHHVDVAAAATPMLSSRDVITSYQSENMSLVSEVQDFETTKILPLKENLDQLAKEIGQHSSSIAEEVTESCKLLSENISRHLALLRQGIYNQSLVLETAEKRLIWENDMEEGQSRLDFINHQLQLYISKKNKCVAQQDVLSNEMIQELVEERADIADQCSRFKEDTMAFLLAQYEQVNSLFLRLPLTKAVPVHIQERMENSVRNTKKLEEALSWREKELDYIKQRCELELEIKSCMMDLEQFRKSINLFLDTKGRWNSDDTKSQAEDQWIEEKQKFDKYKQTTLQPIREKYAQLKQLSDSLKPGFMSETHSKKIEALAQIEESVDADVCYARDVVTQKKQILEFLGRASELEKLAEAVKENFLTSADKEMSGHNSQLENLVSRVESIKRFVTGDIIIPKRSNEQDISMPTKVKDKTMNSVTQDLISTKIARLDELVESLSALFRSQEVFTRLQYVLKIFNRQSKVCSTWITSRRDILEKSVHILDDDNLAMDINHLRDAVSEADSIQTAMRAHDNNFTLLSKNREKYIQVFDEQGLLTDEEKEDKMTEFDLVSEVFEDISHQWDDLLLETKEVSNALSIALLPAELNGRIGTLMASFEILQAQIKAVDESSISDHQLSEWQKSIDYLEYKEYDRLFSEIADYKHTMTADMIETLMAKLDQAGDTVLEIRATLTSLYDLINASRLRNTHAENSELFHKSAEKIIVSIAETQAGKFSIITDKQSSEERSQHFKELTLLHKQIKEAILECQGFYDDSNSYYSAIKVQDVNTFETQNVQSNVDSVWNKVQLKNSELSAFVTRASKWIEGCDELDKLKKYLEILQVDTDKFSSSGNTTANGKLQKFEKQLSQITMSQEELENNVKNTPDMDQDELNKVNFLSRSQGIREFAQRIQHGLDKRRMEKERISLFEVYKSEIAKVSKICEDQIAYIRQQSNTNPEHHLKKAEAINSTINAYSAALSHIQDNYSECKIKHDGIISDHAVKLVKTFDHPSSEVESAKANLDKLLKELLTALKTENDYITSLKLLGRLMKFEKEISRNINDLKAGATSRPYSNSKLSSRTSRTRDLPELKEFMQRYESVENSVAEYQQKCDDLKKNLNKRISAARITAINKSVDKRKEEVYRKWMEIKSSADETRDRLDMLHKRQTVSLKLSESLKYVSSLKGRVEVLQLSGQSVSIEEQELDELQVEIDVTLKKYSQDIDAILQTLSHSEIVSTSSISEGSLKSQREKLKVSIEELRQLVKHRIKQAHTEGSITEFFGITDQVDAEVLMLSKVIEKTSTQHAGMIGSKFDKADLQRLLKTLTTSYKKIEPTITQLLTKAKLEAQKQFLDDNDRVAKRIKKTLKDWDNVQASVTSREKELQTCIKELNHEFFTKLAMAKSAPRERRARRGSKARDEPNNPAPGPRQSTFRSSTLSTEMKMIAPNNSSNRRSSKTPSSSTNGKISNSKYVADPKNELDVQLGMIVNDSPFKMKVKMVPGEVGKYWFGDEHPRLVYCRILPSKMVMVRVGGGWVELSKYMKDHGHSDNLTTKSDSGETRYLTVTTFNDADEMPSFSVTTRSNSPMGPIIGTPIIRRGSGVSSSLTNRSSNSSSGYVEGDRFIQTDDEGNQVALKMVKADSTAKTPSSAAAIKKRGGI